MLMYDPLKGKLVLTNSTLEDVQNIINTASAMLAVDSIVFQQEGVKYIVRNLKPISIKIEFDFERMEEL